MRRTFFLSRAAPRSPKSGFLDGEGGRGGAAVGWRLRGGLQGLHPGRVLQRLAEQIIEDVGMEEIFKVFSQESEGFQRFVEQTMKQRHARAAWRGSDGAVLRREDAREVHLNRGRYFYEHLVSGSLAPFASVCGDCEYFHDFLRVLDSDPEVHDFTKVFRRWRRWGLGRFHGHFSHSVQLDVECPACRDFFEPSMANSYWSLRGSFAVLRFSLSRYGSTHRSQCHVCTTHPHHHPPTPPLLIPFLLLPWVRLFVLLGLFRAISGKLFTFDFFNVTYTVFVFKTLSDRFRRQIKLLTFKIGF